MGTPLRIGFSTLQNTIIAVQYTDWDSVFAAIDQITLLTCVGWRQVYS